MTRLSRSERSALFQKKKSVAGLLEVAEQVVESAPEPSTQRVSVAAPSEPETSYRSRRTKRLVPELSPLNWFDALEKWNPLPLIKKV
jgi:hypothetical protein